MRNILISYLFILFLASVESDAQISAFPYNEGFESSFTTGINVVFISDWTGNEVATINRIFRDGINQNSGTGSLAVIPTGSFTGEIVVMLNFTNLTDAVADFVARSVQNGSGTRPAIVHFSTSIDGGSSYSAPVLIGTAAAFPNVTTPYGSFSYQFPASSNGISDVRLRITVAQSPDSSGTTARFVIDDFMISGNSFTDTVAPTVNDVFLISPTQLDIKFSEPVSLSTAQNPGNFFVNNSVGNPQSALIDAADSSLVHLTFTNSFLPDIAYEITINNIEDLNGNVMNSYTTNFGIFNVQSNDIIINEIMADPDPPVGLPIFEYLELFNKKNFAVDMTGWTITIGSAIKTFGSVTLPADSFLIVGTATAISALQSYGPVAAVFTSSTTLSNSGTSLVLKDSSGNIINAVTYSDSWYQNSIKDDGGWSLELINPESPCASATNWKASDDPSGGTPGRTNSVYGTFSDIEAPRLIRAAAISPTQIHLTFSEPMDTSTLVDAALYIVDNGIGTPLNASMYQAGNEIVVLNLSQAISFGIVYTVTVSPTLRDCSGNYIGNQRTAKFGLSEAVSPKDVIINEVLFNPYTGGSDFVELFNRSDKIIDLATLKIGNADPSTIKNITAESYLLFPDDYVVLTDNPENIKNTYYTKSPDNFINVPLPTYANENGTVALVDSSYQPIDQFSYDEKMHFPLLTDVKGVSLERIYPDRPTEDISNWHSASQNAGFATPTYRNSQYKDTQPLAEEMSIDPEIFSPDNDGHNDVTNINFNFNTPGFVVTVTVFDARGRLVRKLASNILLGTSENTISWDGINEINEKASVGIYIIFAEAFNAAGEIRKFKKTVVLATKFN